MIDTNILNQVNKAIFGVNQSLSLIDQGTGLSVNSILQGGSLQAQGYLLQAQGLRTASSYSNQTYNFNSAIDSINTIRNINFLSTEFQHITSKQLAAQSNSGISVGSKSALALRQETMGIYQEKIEQVKTDSENVRRSKLFESQIQQFNYNQQASAAELNAQSARINAANKATEAQFAGQVQKYKITDQANQYIATLLSNISLGD